jgi:hypothetical protein
MSVHYIWFKLSESYIFLNIEDVGYTIKDVYVYGIKLFQLGHPYNVDPSFIFMFRFHSCLSDFIYFFLKLQLQCNHSLIYLLNQVTRSLKSNDCFKRSIELRMGHSYHTHQHGEYFGDSFSIDATLAVYV